MVDFKAPLTAQEIEVLSRMRIPLYFNSNGDTYIAGAFVANGRKLWRDVVSAVLTEMRKGKEGSTNE
jgi:hypothetical protein